MFIIGLILIALAYYFLGAGAGTLVAFVMIVLYGVNRYLNEKAEEKEKREKQEKIKHV